MYIYPINNKQEIKSAILEGQNFGNENFKKMSIKNTKPADTYDGLKTQFFALKRLLESKEVEVAVYRKRIKEFRVERIIELEAELESQKKMNAILTEELNLKTK